MRTLASQMADARGKTVSVRVGAKAADGRDAEFGAAGTTITFPGYRRAYVEGTDEGDAPTGDDERILPTLAVGDVRPARARWNRTATPPPRRPGTPRRRWSSGWRSSASGARRRGPTSSRRSSTAATCGRRARPWCPTWTAFAVVNLMERHFDDLVDYAFTARLEDDLDAIARNEVRKEAWLQSFYFGDDALPGLKRLVEENLDEIDAAEINTFPLGLDADGNEIVVKPGRYGPYVKRGDDTASVPEDLAPDELTIDRAVELLAAPKGDVPIGVLDDLPVYVKNGRYGPYVQWGDADAPPPGETKPKMASLLTTQSPESLSLDDAVRLLSLPRVVGVDPADGQEVRGRQRSLRALRAEGQGVAVARQRGAALHRHPRRRPGVAGPAPPVPGPGAGQAAAARVRRRPRQRAPGRGQGRPLRRVRDRRRDQRVDRPRRPPRADAARARLRAAGHPARAGRRQAGQAGRQEGDGEGRRPRARAAAEGGGAKRPPPRRQRRRRRRRPRSPPLPASVRDRPLHRARGRRRLRQVDAGVAAGGAARRRAHPRAGRHPDRRPDPRRSARPGPRRAGRSGRGAALRRRPGPARRRGPRARRSAPGATSSATGRRGPRSRTRATAASMGADEVRRLSDWAIEGCWPDLVVLLDVDPAVAARRRRARPRPARAGGRRLPRAGADRLPRAGGGRPDAGS